MRETERSAEPRSNADEIAVYDALADNESAVQAMNNQELRVVAAELVTSARRSMTVDYPLWYSARAKITVMVKRVLKHSYLPDLPEQATKTVLAQAELFCAEVVSRSRPNAFRRRGAFSTADAVVKGKLRFGMWPRRNSPAPFHLFLPKWREVC